MSITEIYLFLLADSFITGLILPAKQDLVFTAMRIFGGYNIYLASFISATGISLAACANWLLGKALRTLRKYNNNNNTSLRKEKIINFLATHGHWAGLLAFIPIAGPILTVFAGIIQTNFIKLIALTFLANLLWHISITF